MNWKPQAENPPAPCQPNTEHTPTPWSIGERERLIVSEVPGMCDGGDYYMVAEAKFHSLIQTEEAAANAAFIVKAVNSHAHLWNRVRKLEHDNNQAAQRIQELEGGIRHIMKAAIEGRVCDDVAWFDGITTLHDFCADVLGEARTPLNPNQGE